MPIGLRLQTRKRDARATTARRSVQPFVKFFQKSFRTDSGCPTSLCTIARMKTYSTRYRRRSLLPVPYSVRHDRLERGIRMLRALRLSLAAPSPAARVQQCEFEFAFGKAA